MNKYTEYALHYRPMPIALLVNHETSIITVLYTFTFD